MPSVAEQRRAVNQTVGSVGFIDSEEFKNRFTNDLRDVLNDTPGVYVQQRYGQEIRLSVRGSGIARGFHLRGIEILQDGIPVNLADGSGDFYQIDPLALRGVEVYKGGNALLYGSSTLGGAINFLTPTGYTAIAPNLVLVDGGSFGTWRAHAQAARVAGPWDLFISGTMTQSEGFREHERQQLYQANGNVGYRIGPNIETRFFFGAYSVAQKLPGTLYLGDALHRPWLPNPAAVIGDQSRETRVERIANRTTISFDVGRLDIDSWGIHKNLYHPIFQVIDQDGWTYGISPRYTAGLDIGGFRDDLFVGARAYGGNNRALQYVNIAGQRGALTLDSRQDAYNYEAYGENRFFFLPTVAFMTGVKFLRDERRYTDFGLPSRPAHNFDSRTYEGANPKVGLLWEPVRDIQFFTDLTRSQDVPDFTDLTQTFGTTTRFVPLEAQRAWTVEVGTRGKWDRFRWDVTAYRSTIRDELLQFTTNPNVPASTFNADSTVHQGIEFGAGLDLLRDVSGPGRGDAIAVYQLWNYSDFHFVRDAQYLDNKIAGIPRNVLRTTVSYTHPSGFYFSPSLDWVPRGAYADFANTLQVPGYALVGLQTGINFSNGVSVYVDARNLTNRYYVSDLSTITDARKADTQIFYPGNGRSFYAGVKYGF